MCTESRGITLLKRVCHSKDKFGKQLHTFGIKGKPLSMQTLSCRCQYTQQWYISWDTSLRAQRWQRAFVKLLKKLKHLFVKTGASLEQWAQKEAFLIMQVLQVSFPHLQWNSCKQPMGLLCILFLYIVDACSYMLHHWLLGNRLPKQPAV